MESMESSIVSATPISVTVNENPTAPAVSVEAVLPAVLGVTLVPAMAMTPKRNTARKPPKEPHTLMAFAIENGGRVELTAANKAELQQRGLPTHRISNAAYGIRKCFGKTVTTERNGRTVSAYMVQI